MLKAILNTYRVRRYSNEVRRTRSLIAPGAKILLSRGGLNLPATVLNVRGYRHGETEVYAQSETGTFSGWFPISEVLPRSEVTL